MPAQIPTRRVSPVREQGTHTCLVLAFIKNILDAIRLLLDGVVPPNHYATGGRTPQSPYAVIQEIETPRSRNRDEYDFLDDDGSPVEDRCFTYLEGQRLLKTSYFVHGPPSLIDRRIGIR